MASGYQEEDHQQQQQHHTHNEPVTIRLRWAKAVRKTPKPDVPYESYHDQQQYHQHHQHHQHRHRSRSPSRSEGPGRTGFEGEAGESGEAGEADPTDLVDPAEADDDVEAGRVMVVQASGLWTLRRLVLAFCTSRRVRESEVALYHRGVLLRIDGPPHATATVSSAGLADNDLIVVRAGRHTMLSVRHFTHASSGEDGSGGARSSQQQQRVVRIAMCEHDDLLALRDRLCRVVGVDGSATVHLPIQPKSAGVRPFTPNAVGIALNGGANPTVATATKDAPANTEALAAGMAANAALRAYMHPTGSIVQGTSYGYGYGDGDGGGDGAVRGGEKGVTLGAVFDRKPTGRATKYLGATPPLDLHRAIGSLIAPGAVMCYAHVMCGSTARARLVCVGCCAVLHSHPPNAQTTPTVVHSTTPNVTPNVPTSPHPSEHQPRSSRGLS